MKNKKNSKEKPHWYAKDSTHGMKGCFEGMSDRVIERLTENLIERCGGFVQKVGQALIRNKLTEPEAVLAYRILDANMISVIKAQIAHQDEQEKIRSEERRVGKECRSRRSPYH